MLTDTINNLPRYDSIIPHIKSIGRYLDKNNIKLLDSGKYPIENEAAYLLIQNYTTNNESDKKWESHRKYIDIQLVLSGFEYIGCCPAKSLIPIEDYNESKDIIFYNEIKDGFSRLYIQADTFAVFSPGEAHKPGCHISEPSAVKKAVFKISYE
ncbi:MAG: YhcH/YjgK/YiaL family protein [Ignavibacteria bacterium]